MSTATPTPLTSTAGTLRCLQQWVDHGWLRPLDLALARFFHEQTEATDAPIQPLLVLGAALTSHQVGRGHICLDLQQLQARPDELLALPPEDIDDTAPPQPSELLARVNMADWEGALNNTLLVSPEAEDTAQAASCPLIRSGTRLYLRRYWQYEQTIRHGIEQRLGDSPFTNSQEAALAEALATLFPDNDPSAGPNWQKIACSLAARHRFSIITGGPGTGKTTTVVRLLAALQHLALTGTEAQRPWRIRLAAPTGKAAARLNESIGGAVEGLPLADMADQDDIRKHIPKRVQTLHRLLGSRPDTRHSRHNRENPLDLDVLVIDEASMVDMEMAARVVDALPGHARLILLGDKDQLASVEAGAVLGDLCQRADGGHYQTETRDWVQTMTGEVIPDAYQGEAPRPLDQCITMLRRSHRFDDASGIGRLALAVKRGAQDEVEAVWEGGYADIARLRFSNPAQPQLYQHFCEGGADHFPNLDQGRTAEGEPLAPPVGYDAYLRLMHQQQPAIDAPEAAFDEWANNVLKAFDDFQLLCANRRGPFGVEGFNERIGAALKQRGLLRASEGWYPGRPVLVTGNDYSLGLMNGDVGIALSVPRRPRAGAAASGGWLIRVAFPTHDGSNRIKWIVPSRLQAVETAFAMTVHKSQGSEFTHTCLVLPNSINPVITRELIYTAITRASAWFSLAVSNPGVLNEGIQRRVIRTSGLGEMFYGPVVEKQHS